MSVSRHLIYEQVSKDEENAFIKEALAVARNMPKPRGWTKKESKGRPKKRGKGRPPEYGGGQLS